ncbi:hypothetical protein LguiA_030401 [Lonicera macranthoides]
MKKTKVLLQAAGSMNIQGIRDFTYEPARPDDFFAVFEDVNFGEINERGVEPGVSCQNGSEVSKHYDHIFTLRVFQISLYYFKRDKSLTTSYQTAANDSLSQVMCKNAYCRTCSGIIVVVGLNPPGMCIASKDVINCETDVYRWFERLRAKKQLVLVDLINYNYGH